MLTTTITEIVPIKINKDGVFLIGKTRITLDTVVAAFNEGIAAEEIARQYPSAQLADIYSALGYYLRHKKQIDAYINRREKIALKIRKQNEVRFNETGIRERLLARRQTRKK